MKNGLMIVVMSSRFFYDGDITYEFIDDLFRKNINPYQVDGMDLNFFFKCSDKLQDKMTAIPVFVPVEEYPEPKSAFENEIGSIGSVKIMLTRTLLGLNEFIFFVTRGYYDRKKPRQERMK